MTEPVILDCYCSAGGVGLALSELGIPHVGLDVRDYSDSYPGDFAQADCSSIESIVDALDELYGYVPDFELIWLSPPCLAYTPLSNVNASRYEWDETPKERYPTIPELNVHLVAESFGKEYVIENVSRCDDLRDPIEINGHAFGMGVECRHKFETSFDCPHALGTGKTKMMAGHTNERKEMAELKGVPETWTLEEINSAIPKPYVQHLLYHAGFDVEYPGELVQSTL